jgi:hypothetical protein
MYEINLFAEKKETLNHFLIKFYGSDFRKIHTLNYEQTFENPVDMVTLISTLIDNNDKYEIGVWVSIDSNIYINITENNLDKVIKYFFERYPWEK